MGKITDNNQKTKAANLKKRGVPDFHGYYISKFKRSVFSEKHTHTHVVKSTTKGVLGKASHTL